MKELAFVTPSHAELYLIEKYYKKYKDKLAIISPDSETIKKFPNINVITDLETDENIDKYECILSSRVMEHINIYNINQYRYKGIKFVSIVPDMENALNLLKTIDINSMMYYRLTYEITNEYRDYRDVHKWFTSIKTIFEYDQEANILHTDIYIDKTKHILFEHSLLKYNTYMFNKVEGPEFLVFTKNKKDAEIVNFDYNKFPNTFSFVRFVVSKIINGYKLIGVDTDYIIDASSISKPTVHLNAISKNKFKTIALDFDKFQKFLDKLHY